MATRKKMSGEDNTVEVVETPVEVVEVVETTEEVVDNTEEVVETTEEVVETTIKYRSDFKSWEEYYTYEGVKG
jgi:TRAP-type mannitol/chloroaromatic compound transport system substrate-binding protein